MADTEVRGVAEYSANTSEYNSLSFIIQQAIRQQVNTCMPCKVVGVNDGYVDVLPLVTQISGKGEAVEPTTVHHLPYMRYHAGICAVKLDPIVGDIGLIVICDKDCGAVKRGITSPAPPASYRGNNLANGFYIGGFLNQEPSTYIELKQDASIVINAPAGLTINGNVTVTGSVSSSGDMVGGGISLDNHTHTCPDGETSPPH
jgi:hypothetical protein